MSIERTLVLIKPDGVTRNLTGSIIARIEAKGYTLAELKKVDASRGLLEQHYEEHVGKPFYEPLAEFMLSRPLVAAIFEGHRVIEGFRSLAGTTDPTTAAPGTIRGDFGRDWGLKVSRTWSTARTPRSPRSARSKSGSRTDFRTHPPAEVQLRPMFASRTWALTVTSRRFTRGLPRAPSSRRSR